MPMALRVGIDTVSVESVQAALQAHGQRYLERVYTAREIADCTGADGVDPERLAARFAAKEAAVKALRIVGGVAWTAVEVVRDPGGWPELVLHGAAAERAREGGLDDSAVSLTHEAGLASAVVVLSSLKTSGGSADAELSHDEPNS
ncbi:MAG: holo-[acyl-carrier protein] synthase [Solirubrobacteraceae bacterium]|jgi:holo-[acyl-carrier protein] synthase|nr:holo-[acyl-carrier protein] synthase [Solirubrobacteraceae bacterium]